MNETVPVVNLEQEQKKPDKKVSEDFSFDGVQKRVALLRSRINKISDNILPYWQSLEQELFFLEFAEEVDHYQGDKRDSILSASRALLYVSALGKEAFAENLIKKHYANVNYKNDNKETPLLIALKRKRLKMVEFLLKNGADIKGTYQENEAKKIVCSLGFDLALPILEKYGADFSKPYVRMIKGIYLIPLRRIKVYPILIAALKNQKKIVEIISKKTMSTKAIKAIETALKKPERFHKDIRILLEKSLYANKKAFRNKIAEKTRD